MYAYTISIYAIIRTVIILNRLSVMRLLSQLTPGEIATIGAIHAEQQLHQRLLALGFRAGKKIEMIRRANFQGPLQVRIGATDIILRESEANLIQINQ